MILKKDIICYFEGRESFKYYLVLLSNTMETVSVKFEENLAHDIDRAMKRHRYATKTEFIREAVRDKIKYLEKEELLLKLKKTYGASKKKTTDEELHAVRESVMAELEKELK